MSRAPIPPPGVVVQEADMVQHGHSHHAMPEAPNGCQAAAFNVAAAFEERAQPGYLESRIK